MPKLHFLVARNPLEKLPGGGYTIAVDRVVGVLGDILDKGEDRTNGGHWPPGPVQPAEALPERVERCGLGDEPVQVEIDAHFQTLGGDDEQRSRMRTDGNLGKDRELTVVRALPCRPGR